MKQQFKNLSDREHEILGAIFANMFQKPTVMRERNGVMKPTILTWNGRMSYQGVGASVMATIKEFMQFTEEEQEQNIVDNFSDRIVKDLGLTPKPKESSNSKKPGCGSFEWNKSDGICLNCGKHRNEHALHAKDGVKSIA